MRCGAVGAFLACGLALAAAASGPAAWAAQPQGGNAKSAGLSAAAWGTVPGPTRGAAQAIGGYAAGCLAGGAALAPEGVGYQAIRLSRKRTYGHPVLIDYMRDFGRRVAAAGLGTALVADMNQPRGGPMPFGHASHQIGLDADVWLRLDLPPLDRKARESVQEINFVDYGRRRVRADLWGAAQAELIRIAADDPRVARIFVHPTIKLALCERTGPGRSAADRAWLRKVRPWYGHDGHMHIRLSCPPGNPLCEEQRALPEGDGCDPDLNNWIRDANRPIPVRSPAETPPRRPKLPAACTAVLRGAPASVVSMP